MEIEKTYIEKFESLKTAVLQKIELRTETETETENPNSRIFRNVKCWRLFEYLKENSVRSGKELADLSYFFKAMKDDGFILSGCGNTEFYMWLNDKYNLELDRLLNPIFDRLKDANYVTAKRVFQLTSIKKSNFKPLFK